MRAASCARLGTRCDAATNTVWRSLPTSDVRPVAGWQSYAALARLSANEKRTVPQWMQASKSRA
ncbi:MAG: hypothetical protein K6T27_00710, partial [Thermoleophilum sp.]|nr:hypothetical protein [Thermoleophilum sp.]